MKKILLCPRSFVCLGAALGMLLAFCAAPPAHAMAKQTLFTLTSFSDAGDLIGADYRDAFTVPAVTDRPDNIATYHAPGNWQFGIGHHSLTASVRHDALAFALVGNLSHAPEVASLRSIAG